VLGGKWGKHVPISISVSQREPSGDIDKCKGELNRETRRKSHCHLENILKKRKNAPSFGERWLIFRALSAVLKEIFLKANIRRH